MKITEDIPAGADMIYEVSADMSVVLEPATVKPGDTMGRGQTVAHGETKMAVPRMYSSADQVDGSMSLLGQSEDLTGNDKPTRCISTEGIDDVARRFIMNELPPVIIRVATKPVNVMTDETSAASSSSTQTEPHPTDASITTLISTTPNPQRNIVFPEAMLEITPQRKPVTVPTLTIMSMEAIRRT
ncbi:hypothetical protein ACMFMG_001672 [Clarireedia jacksonii]